MMSQFHRAHEYYIIKCILIEANCFIIISIQKEKQTDIYGKVTAKIGEPITLELFSGVDDISVKVKGECVSQAAKRPVEVTQIIDKLSKTGGTGFNFYLESECDENIFISLGSLNVLRREAVRRLEQALIGRYRRRVSDEMKRHIKDVCSPSFCHPVLFMCY